MLHVWSVTNLELDRSNERVTSVDYLLESTYGGDIVRSYGKLKLTGEISTPYNKITKGLAVSWVKRTMGKEAVEYRESKHEEQLNKTEEFGSPW